MPVEMEFKAGANFPAVQQQLVTCAELFARIFGAGNTGVPEGNVCVVSASRPAGHLALRLPEKVFLFPV
jgi:hypothetical protein